jgi:hypothetical protein
MEWQEHPLASNFDAAIKSLDYNETFLIIGQYKNHIINFTLLYPFNPKYEAALEPDKVDLIENYIMCYFIKITGPEKLEKLKQLFEIELKCDYWRHYKGYEAIESKWKE